MRLIEKYWYLIVLTLSVIYSFFFESNLFNASVLCSGVLCVSLIAKGNIWNYLPGMYNTVAYAYVTFNEHLYGEFGLYAFFYLPTNIIGFLMWRKRAVNNVVTSNTLTFKGKVILFLSTILLTLILGFILDHIPNQKNPYLDAFVTMGAVIAMILMLKCYTEQWVLYVLLNTVSILLWVFRYTDDSEVALSMIVMFFIYWINSVFGWYIWKIRLKNENRSSIR